MNHKQKQSAYANIVQATMMLLTALGEDLDRPGLQGTPERVARSWINFISYEDDNTDTTFAAETTPSNMVIVRNIEVWSMCEHHLMPFRAVVSVGYITGKKILGLSKFARIAKVAAHRLQLQERLTADIAKEIARVTGVDDVAVYIQGEHLCMVARGAEAHGTDTITSELLGAFRDNPETRAEFMAAVGRNR